MTKPLIGIILSTTRQGRFADRPAAWLQSLADARDDADYEIIDLRDYDIPLFEEPLSPRYKPIENAEARRFAAKIAELDGYVFITAEYNHSVSGAIKNALDYLAEEGGRKPAAFLGYGSSGATRAVEHLRLIAVEVSMVPTRAAVHINMEPFLGLMREGKDFADYPYLGDSAAAMLDELVWYARVLKEGRKQQLAKAA